MITQSPINTDRITTYKKKKDIYLGNIVHGIDCDPIKALHMISQSPVDMIQITSYKNKKDIYLGNIIHGINCDPIKALHMITHSPVDTDSNHILQKQKKYLSREHAI